MAAGSVIIDLLFRTASFESDTQRAAKALGAIEQASAKVSAQIDSQIKSLQIQAATFGLSARQATVYELALKGASDQQLKAAESALASVEAQQLLAKAGTFAVTALKGIAAGAAGAVAGFELLVNAAGSFKDLEQETGASAESLASLSTAAAVSDLSIQDIANSTVKLTKALIGVEDGGKPAGAALNALGINIADFKKLDPVAQIDALTKAFAGFADGSGKTAVAVQLFGKNGAQMLKVLQELNDEGGRQVILTQAQIELADDYTDRQKKLVATIKQYAEAAATDVLPALNALTGAIKDGVAQLVGIGDAGHKLATDNPVKAFAEDAGRAVAGLVDYIHTSFSELKALGDFGQSFAIVSKQLLSGDIAGAKQTGADFRARYGLDANGMGTAGKQAGHAFLDSYNQTLELAHQAGANQSPAESARLNRRPQLNATATTKDTSGKDLKSQLDGELKIIKDGEKAQADAYQFANSYLQGVYQDGLINQEDYFAAQKQLRDANLANVVKALDDEIKDRQDAVNSGKLSSSESVTQSKAIALAQQQRAEAITKAGASDILAAQTEAREVERLSVSYDNLRASILSSSGNDVAAAQIKNAQTLKQAAQLINSRGDEGNPNVLGDLEKQLDAQTARTAQQKAYSQLLDDTQRKEAEIYLDAQAGGKSELDTLLAIRDSRSATIVLLKQQLDAAQALAEVTNNPVDIKHAQDLGLAYKKALADIDPLAKSINDSLEGSFSSAFAEFINGSKSAKEAFQDFANSVLNNIADIYSKRLALQVFGDTGGSSGIGGFLSGLFGRGDPSNGSDVVGGTTGSAPDISNTVFTPEAVHLAKGTNRVPYDNFPAMLHKDEAVVPAAFNPANHGGGNVYITNNAPAEASASRDSNGDWQVVIDAAAKRGARMTTSDLASGTGPSAQAVRGRFALGPGYLPKRG